MYFHFVGCTALIFVHNKRDASAFFQMKQKSNIRCSTSKKHQNFSLFPYLFFSDGFVLLPPCLKNRGGNRAAALVAAPAKQENWKHFAV